MNFNDYTIPDLTGKKVIITGSNSGIGLYVAKQFVKNGAEVILACRNQQRAKDAVESIKQQIKNAKCTYINLDLNSFDSINSFVNEVTKKHHSIDILINNAGVVIQDVKNTSKDGFDPHIATNCLGPFILTNKLLPLLEKSEFPRIVTVSSFAEKVGLFNINRFAEKKLPGWLSYLQSKISNLIFSYELNRKLKENNSNIVSVASHPGLTITHSSQIAKFSFIVKKVGMPIEQGAMSLIIAATNPDLKGGEYIGYKNFFNLNGSAGLNKSSKITYNKKVAKQLWTKLEELTNTKFTL